jgi:hypothetical protein
MKIRVIITGVTGMVGEGVLHECLQNEAVEQILVLGRKTCGVVHPKIKEVLHNNFFDLSSVSDQLSGYNACFFCLGVSSIGMKEPEYYKLTYTLTMYVAETLAPLNREMTFCYISGVGTDSSEKGRSMWAKVKGKTENNLAKLPFKQVYHFRPGMLRPTPGLKNVHKSFKYFNWLYPALRLFLPAYVGTLQELGLAMIHVVNNGYPKQVLEVKDIRSCAHEEQART